MGKLIFSGFESIEADFETMGEEKKQELKNYIDAPAEKTLPENKAEIIADDNNKNDSIEKIEKFFPAQHDVDINIADLESAPEEWNFFKMPDEETFKLIVKSIYHQGQLAPALVWKHEYGDKYTILGGHTRFAAIKVLHELYPENERFTKMRCHVYEFQQLDEASAQFIVITNNMTQRAKEAPSVQVRSIVKALDLQKKIKKETWGEINESSAQVVSKVLGLGVRTVNRYYKLKNLIPGFLMALDLGNISQKEALLLSDMKPEIQEYLNRGELLHIISKEKLTRLAKASSIEEAETIINASEVYSFGGVALSYQVPKEFSKLNLAVDKSDIERVKELFLQAIEKEEFQNEQTKLILTDILTSPM